MSQPPTITGDSAVAELLEREEKKALERFEQEKKAKEASSKRESSDDTHTSRPQNRRPADSESYDSRHHGSHRRRDSRDRYLTEREENDQRRSRRSRDLADEDARGSSDKDSANGSVRSRHRSRSPPRDHRGDYYRGGGRADDHYRPDQSSRGRDRPYRSRSPPRRHDRGDRRGHRDGPRRSSRDRRGPSPGRKKTPEASTDERDKRTVFVQQLAARLRSRQLEDFFSQAGEVVEAQIVKDRVSQRSKGVGYVEFKDEESVQKAIALTGQKLLGIPIIAQLTEAEKNRQTRQTENGGGHANGAPYHRLYVGNIHFSIGEDDLRGVFESFGELEFVQLQKEEGGRSRGYGFVQYVDAGEAKAALDAMNGFELAGRPIRVGLGNDRFTEDNTKTMANQFNKQQGTAQNQGSSFSGMGGRGTHAGGTANFDRAGGRDADKFAGASALDDTDVSGVQFSNVDRFSLMSKLARTEDTSTKAAPKAQAKKTEIEHPTATRCVVLRNLYDQAQESNPGWQKEIEADVKQECESKFGKVLHIALDLANDDGEVYIKFDTVKAGEQAILSLNGRRFGGRIITAQYVVDAVYHMKWPKAANLS